MNIALRRSGKPYMASSLAFYNQLSESAIVPFKKEGASHILVNKPVLYPGFQLVLENEQYRLYKL
jgi:hypothetical protein